MKLHSIAHITGGGIVGKFAEDLLFPRGLSAKLHSLFGPPEIMRSVAEWRGIPEEECYQTFNGGNGALVVIDEKDVDLFLLLSRRFGIDAKQCGVILEESSPSLEIKSGFGSEHTLKYTP